MLSEYSIELVFNCDEVGLQCHLLPQIILASCLRRELKGEKCKDCVTICACTNVTGNIKFPATFYWDGSQAKLLYMH